MWLWMVSELSAADVQTSAWLHRVITAHNSQFCCSTSSPISTSYPLLLLLLLPPGAYTAKHMDNNNSKTVVSLLQTWCSMFWTVLLVFSLKHINVSPVFFLFSSFSIVSINSFPFYKFFTMMMTRMSQKGAELVKIVLGQKQLFHK